MGKETVHESIFQVSGLSDGGGARRTGGCQLGRLFVVPADGHRHQYDRFFCSCPDGDAAVGDLDRHPTVDKLRQLGFADDSDTVVQHRCRDAGVDIDGRWIFHGFRRAPGYTAWRRVQARPSTARGTGEDRAPQEQRASTGPGQNSLETVLLPGGHRRLGDPDRQHRRQIAGPCRHRRPGQSHHHRLLRTDPAGRAGRLVGGRPGSAWQPDPLAANRTGRQKNWWNTSPACSARTCTTSTAR